MMGCAFHIPALALRVRALKDLIQTSHPPQTPACIHILSSYEMCTHYAQAMQ